MLVAGLQFVTYLDLRSIKGGNTLPRIVRIWETCDSGPNGVQNLSCNKSTKPSGEGNRKIVRFKSLFHILSHGHPLLEYETMYDLFSNFKVPNNLNMHWSDFASWTLVKFMYQQVQKPIIQTKQFAQFFACYCDEVTTIDYGSWIFVHAYVVDG